MKREVILNEMIEEIRRKGFEVELRKTMKNGVEMEGLVFQSEKKVTPILYVDSFIKEIEKGKSMNDVVLEIITLFKVNDGKEIGDVERLMDKDFLISRMKLGVQRSSNEPILRMETELEGIDCYVYVSVSEEGFSFKLTENHLDILEMKKEEVFEVAKTHTFEEGTIRAMSEIISEMVGIEMENDNNMFVVTTKSGFRGASAILNRDMIRNKMEEIFGSGLVKKVIVLPSSIHECIVIPWTVDITDMSFFDSMVKEVNEKEVEEQDVLSNRSYVLNL